VYKFDPQNIFAPSSGAIFECINKNKVSEREIYTILPVKLHTFQKSFKRLSLKIRHLHCCNFAHNQQWTGLVLLRLSSLSGSVHARRIICIYTLRARSRTHTQHNALNVYLYQLTQESKQASQQASTPSRVLLKRSLRAAQMQKQLRLTRPPTKRVISQMSLFPDWLIIHRGAVGVVTFYSRSLALNIFHLEIFINNADELCNFFKNSCSQGAPSRVQTGQKFKTICFFGAGKLLKSSFWMKLRLVLLNIKVEEELD
jgi:hypothetical protein